MWWMPLQFVLHACMYVFHSNPSAFVMECCMESSEQEGVRSQPNATRRPKRKRKGNPRRSPQSQGPRDNPDAWIARPSQKGKLCEFFMWNSIDSKMIQESLKKLHFLANSKMQLACCCWWEHSCIMLLCATQDILERERRGPCAESCFKQNRRNERNAESKAGSERAKKQG